MEYQEKELGRNLEDFLSYQRVIEMWLRICSFSKGSNMWAVSESLYKDCDSLSCRLQFLSMILKNKTEMVDRDEFLEELKHDFESVSKRVSDLGELLVYEEEDKDFLVM